MGAVARAIPPPTGESEARAGARGDGGATAVPPGERPRYRPSTAPISGERRAIGRREAGEAVAGSGDRGAIARAIATWRLLIRLSEKI